MENSTRSQSRILVIVRNEQKGFYISLAQLLSQRFSVTIAADNLPVQQLIRKLLPNQCPEIQTLPERRLEPNVPPDIVEQATEIERCYGKCLAFVLSEDRNLGRGYQTNIDRYIDTKRMWWSHETRLAYLVREIKCYENLLSDINVVISQFPETIPIMICKKLNIAHFHLLPTKFGDYCFWGNDTYYTSDEYRTAIQESLREVDSYSQDKLATPVGYEIDAGGNMLIQNNSYQYIQSIRRISNLIYRDTVNLLRRTRKPNSIRLYGWVPAEFRKIHNYQYVKKNGVVPDSLTNYQLVYFPLHMEPELSLLMFSPEFTNSTEAIIWISKSLPSNWLLVIKEQPKAFQFRSRDFYQRFQQMGNVVLANPDVPAANWINASQFVSTITGSAGIEAVYSNKPVLSFGRHQVINTLPTVSLVTSYEEVSEAVNLIIQKQCSERMLNISRTALYLAQKRISFLVPSFKYSYKSSSLEHDSALIAYNELVNRYPHSFSSSPLAE